MTCKRFFTTLIKINRAPTAGLWLRDVQFFSRWPVGLIWVLVLPCSSCFSAAYETGTQLHAEGNRLVDNQEREVLLRGINARIDGLFDVSFEDGRLPLEPIPKFAEKDLVFLKEQMGMNALRVPINWSGLEPHEGQGFDLDYLDRLDELLAHCAATEMWCLVDLHQDAYSKEIGEDGAPLWAIKPPPDELLEGPLEDLEERRISEQVLRAFATFFGDREGVQDSFISMLERLTEHLKGKPFVAGIEIFNEPVGEDVEVLQFARRAAEAIHAVDADRLVVFEPNALRNLRDYTDPLGGLLLNNTAYAPHLYPEIFSGEGDNFANGDPTRLVASTEAAKNEAEIHGAPLMVTEYGIAPYAEHAVLWMETLEAEMDRVNASRFYWLYEELSQGVWGLYDEDGSLREDWAKVVARPFPSAVQGKIVNFSSTDASMKLTVSGEGFHQIAVPLLWAPDGVTATCNGVEVRVEEAPGWVRVVCRPGSDAHAVIEIMVR